MARTNRLMQYRIENFDEASRYGPHGPSGVPRPDLGLAQGLAPPKSPACRDASARDDTSSEGEIDLAYIRKNKPSTRVVREFMRAQATSVSAAGQDNFDI